MGNHFGKGLMAGLQASYADTAAHAANFCVDYKCGSVLGYLYRILEKTSDRQLSAWEAGILTRRYGLDRDIVMNLFKEGGSGMAMRYFLTGYQLESQIGRPRKRSRPMVGILSRQREGVKTLRLALIFRLDAKVAGVVTLM